MKSFNEWLKLNEMPMSISKIGDWNNIRPNKNDSLSDNDIDDYEAGFGRKALSIFKSDKGINKIIKRYDKISHYFNILLLNTDKKDLISRVSREKALDFLQDELPGIAWNKYIDFNKINFIITTWDQAIPSAWMMSHRLAHALKCDQSFDENLKTLAEIIQLIKKYTDIKYPIHLFRTNFWFASGTMKSVTSGKMKDIYEIYQEFIAQYIMQGRIKLRKVNMDENYFLNNLGSLPSSKDITYVQTLYLYNFSKIEEELNNHIKSCIDNAKDYVYIW